MLKGALIRSEYSSITWSYLPILDYLGIFMYIVFGSPIYSLFSYLANSYFARFS